VGVGLRRTAALGRERAVAWDEHLKRDDLAEGAELLRGVLDSLSPDEDRPRDAVVRRRIEGAVIAAELATGETAPRRATRPSGTITTPTASQPPSARSSGRRSALNLAR